MWLLDLFRPVDSSKDPEQAYLRFSRKASSSRNEAVIQMSEEGLLAMIARKDPECYIQQKAVAKVSDQRMLAEIAQDTAILYTDTRKLAIRKLTDQAILAVLSRSDADADLRAAAVENLSDQTVLAEIAGRDSDIGVRIAAVEALVDQAALAAIAEKDAESVVRIKALEKLEDSNLLARLAKKENSLESLLLILRKGDESVLEVLLPKLSERKDWATAFSAVSAPENKLALCRACPYPEEGIPIVREEKAPAALADIARNAKQEDVAIAAVWELSDAAALEDLARNCPNQPAKTAAQRKLARELLPRLTEETNPEALRQTALTSFVPEVRAAAVRFIGDRKILEALAATVEHPEVKAAASSQLSEFTDSAGIRLLPVPGKSYAIGVFPVTNAQYQQFKPGHDSTIMFPGCNQPRSRMDAAAANHPEAPVVCVTRADALDFCRWLSEKEGKLYRLPAFDEWEHALEADAPGWYRAQKYGAGSKLYRWEHLWVGLFGREKTRPVGESLPNPWGFRDMLGHVFHWISDDPASEPEMRSRRIQEVMSRGIVGPGLNEYLAGTIRQGDYHAAAGVGWGDGKDLFGPWKRDFFSGPQHALWEDKVGFRVACELR